MNQIRGEADSMQEEMSRDEGLLEYDVNGSVSPASGSLDFILL